MIPRTADPRSLRLPCAGPVVGSMLGPAVHAWKGIRYAQPPVGPLRWRAPQPLQPWSETLEALQYGKLAPQYAGLLAPVNKKHYGQVIGDEDCLTLNIFAPAWSIDQVPQTAHQRPVMVWLHGGGNAVGTPSSYDVLKNYAEHDDLIVVSISHRLGVLGWFCHPALHEADSATDEERSGNFATLDLIAALRWIRSNIGAFGGNPENVTIFGESAGAQNVLALLASPLAAGLFHKAIAQSPVTETVSVEEAVSTHLSPYTPTGHSAIAVTRKLLEKFGEASTTNDAPTTTVEFLRSLTPRELLSVFTPGTAGIYMAPRHIRDGVVLPKQPLCEVFSSGDWNKVPLIIGSNRDEYRTFLADKPEHSRLLFGQIPILRDRKAYLETTNYFSRAWRAAHVDAVVDAMVAGGHRDIWSYRFDWDEAPAIAFIRPDLLLGAAHAMEMAFAFRDFSGEFDIFGVNSFRNKKGRFELYQAMGDAWTSFAAQGTPVISNGPVWRQHDNQEPVPASMVFDTTKGGGIRMITVRESMDTLKKQLLDTASIKSYLRCAIYARLFLWSPLFRHWGSQIEFDELCQQWKCHATAADFRPHLEI